MRKSAEQKKLVADWNAAHAVGTPVTRYQLVNPRSGDTIDTATRSEAWLLSGHTAVVLVSGLDACVMVESLEVREGRA